MKYLLERVANADLKSSHNYCLESIWCRSEHITMNVVYNAATLVAVLLK